MTKQEMADWARADPGRARRYIREQERLLRQRQRRARPSAAAKAFIAAFLVVMVGMAMYPPWRSYGWFERLTWAENASVGVAVLIVWLVFWGLISAWRRRSQRRDGGQG